MPFESKAQVRFMFRNHPQIARRWARTYGIPDDLPEHVQHARRALRKRGEKRKKDRP